MQKVTSLSQKSVSFIMWDDKKSQKYHGKGNRKRQNGDSTSPPNYNN